MNAPRIIGADSRCHVNVLDDTGDVGLELDPVVTSDKGLSRVLADEAFMNEIVVVHVHSSQNQADPPHFILNVNGTNQPVIRGHDNPMRRKYLEVLARMKATSFSQPERNPMSPDAGNQLIPHTSMVYPFNVVRDDNPRGPAWLSAVMAEA